MTKKYLVEKNWKYKEKEDNTYGVRAQRRKKGWIKCTSSWGYLWSKDTVGEKGRRKEKAKGYFNFSSL